MYSPTGDCGAYREGPNGDVCFVWNGVKVEWQEFFGQLHQMKAENVALRAEVDRYKVALEKIATVLLTPCATPKLSEGRKDEAWEIARAAL